jgi:hypothetical protein
VWGAKSLFTPQDHGEAAIRVFGFLDATASVVVLPGAAKDKFTFAFIQVCRPFEVQRAIYHQIGTPAGNEIDWDPGERIRPLEKDGKVVKSPDRLAAFDVPVGATFTPMVSVKAAAKSEDRGKQKRPPPVETREISQGALANLFFEDAPQVRFDTNKEHKGKFYDLAGFAVRLFYTALVVRLPSGTIKPLKAFFWQIKACETLNPGPDEGEAYTKNLFQQKELGTIEVSPIFDCRSGDCFAGQLDLSLFRDGKLGSPVPTGQTCNEIADNAVAATKPKGPGAFSIGC